MKPALIVPGPGWAPPVPKYVPPRGRLVPSNGHKWGEDLHCPCGADWWREAERAAACTHDHRRKPAALVAVDTRSGRRQWSEDWRP